MRIHRKIIPITLLIIAVVVMSCSYNTTEIAAPPVVIKTAAEDDQQELVDLMNLNLRYILNDWWNNDKIYVFDHGSSYYDHNELTEKQQREIHRSTESFRNWRRSKYLSLCLPEDTRGYDENSIRPVSHAVYCIAASLQLGYYDEHITGISADDARQMCIKLLSSAAGLHKTNKRNGWGQVWQSPLWAENIGFAAWLLWEDLPERDKKNVINMLMCEADYVTYHYDLPYYLDKYGNIIYEGDTKGEEIAWHAKVLALTSVMFPENANYQAWESKLYRSLVAATATPDDVGSSRIIDDIIIGDFLEGSNINSNGTVVNHSRIHVDYMTTIFEEMGECIAVFKMAGKNIPESSVFNLDLIYKALADLDLGIYDDNYAGHYFYERDLDGNPTGEVCMPGINDWGIHWYANCYLTDVIADTMQLDQDLNPRYQASRWADLHLLKVKEQVYRKNEDGIITGQFFQKGENDFVSGDLFQMHNLTEAYIIMTY